MGSGASCEISASDRDLFEALRQVESLSGDDLTGLSGGGYRNPRKESTRWIEAYNQAFPDNQIPEGFRVSGRFNHPNVAYFMEDGMEGLMLPHHGQERITVNGRLVPPLRGDTYNLFDNGYGGFRVVVGKGPNPRVQVFSNMVHYFEPYLDAEPRLFDNGYRWLVAEWEHVSRVWLGRDDDPRFGDCDGKCGVNTILLEFEPQHYVMISEDIFSFETEEPITVFKSIMGHSGCPLPYALSQTRVYNLSSNVSSYKRLPFDTDPSAQSSPVDRIIWNEGPRATHERKIHTKTLVPRQGDNPATPQRNTPITYRQ